MLNFFKKKKEWRDDDYILLEELKQKRSPETYFDPKKFETKKEVKKEKIEEDVSNKSNVRKRLEELQSKSSKLFFINDEPKPEPEVVKKEEICAERPYLKDVEKKLKKIEALRSKMKNNPGSYLSLFYDLKKAEKNFLESLKKLEESNIDLPENLKIRVKEAKSKIKTI